MNQVRVCEGGTGQMVGKLDDECSGYVLIDFIVHEYYVNGVEVVIFTLGLFYQYCINV